MNLLLLLHIVLWTYCLHDFLLNSKEGEEVQVRSLAGGSPDDSGKVE